ncbi:MAG TPA: hypothetical protein VGM73_15865 [Candidatus Didemnitutus sp.]
MVETEIKDALIRFAEAIKRSDGPALSAALNDVEALCGAHRAELHPRLLHFLEGRSYAKALAWFGESREFGSGATPPGGCQPK